MSKRVKQPNTLTGELKKAASQFPEIVMILKKAKIDPSRIFNINLASTLPDNFASHAIEGLRSSRWIVTSKAAKRHILKEMPGENNMLDISGILEAVPKNHEIAYIVLLQATGPEVVSLEVFYSPEGDIHQRIVNALADRVMGYA